MVVTRLPATDATERAQDRTATPSTSTVQAPHWDSPQPYFVPVRSRSSRNTSSRSRSGSVVTALDWPFSVNVMDLSITGTRFLLDATTEILSPTVVEQNFGINPCARNSESAA